MKHTKVKYQQVASESGKCVRVERHVYPVTVVSVSYH